MMMKSLLKLAIMMRFFAALFFTLRAVEATGTGGGGDTDTGGETWGGVPENTFEIPVSNPANGIYLKDIQASYRNVDWMTLDRLYIPAGHYKLIKIGNLPNRSPDRPLIITNIGGQVKVGGLGHYYIFVVSGGTNWILTGKYDPISQTGDVNFPGHHSGGGSYANSHGRYGILVDDGPQGRSGNSGIAVGSRIEPTSDFRISYVEIRYVGFAGMLIKSDNLGYATMRNVQLHDNYIHDVGSEGMYLGSTQGGDQHSFENLKVYNNRILRSGTEGLQASQLGDGCEIHNNVVALSAIDWKDAFQDYQNNCVQIQHRYGSVSVHHNIFIGAGGNLLIFFALNNQADTHTQGDTFRVHDNFFSSSRMNGVYMGQRNEPHSSPQYADDVTSYEFSNNSFRQFDFQLNELNPNASPPDKLIKDGMPRYMNNTIHLVRNSFDSPAAGLDDIKLTKAPYCPWVDLNGISCRTTATNNVREVVEPVTFVNFFQDIPPDVDYLLMEKWSDTCSRCSNSNEAIHYEVGDYVFHNNNGGMMYRAKVANSGVEPGLDNDTTWDPLPAPVDDVRLTCDSAHQGVGLLDTMEDCDGPNLKDMFIHSADETLTTRDDIVVALVREGLELIGDDEEEKFNSFVQDLQDLIDSL